MTNIRELVDKVRSEYQTVSVVADVREKEILTRSVKNQKLYESGDIFQKDTMPSVLQVLF